MAESLDFTALVVALAIVDAVLVLIFAARPEISRGWVGGVAAFAAFVLLPLTITTAGTRSHLERSKSTNFCLSCHEMEPYGRSLELADTDYIPAIHAQNRWAEPGYECFTCHTSYTMYGDLSAKIRGVRHLWVHYLGTIPDPIELYEPYQNRECLHCHGGARRFEENELHTDERAALQSGETSCLECHDLLHAVDELEGAELWVGETLP